MIVRRTTSVDLKRWRSRRRLFVADARPRARGLLPDFVIERLGQVVEIVEQELVG